MSDLPGRPTHGSQRFVRPLLRLLGRGGREACQPEDLFVIVPPRAGGTTGGVR